VAAVVLATMVWAPTSVPEPLRSPVANLVPDWLSAPKPILLSERVKAKTEAAALALPQILVVYELDPPIWAFVAADMEATVVS
jgi:hypothetical protein